MSSDHIVPVRVYLTIFTALVVGTVATVAVAGVDLGWLNTPVALAIAITKASLVVLFFMHVRYSPRLIQLTAVAGFIWFLIMVTFTLSDYLTRDILALGK
ncbi:MAG: caa(3)-type oxidase subunit IV [Luteitalea sp.]|nr:caa(3)-type oxidase subunit IV [Luteitalea sp.]